MQLSNAEGEPAFAVAIYRVIDPATSRVTKTCSLLATSGRLRRLSQYIHFWADTEPLAQEYERLTGIHLATAPIPVRLSGAHISESTRELGPAVAKAVEEFGALSLGAA